MTPDEVRVVVRTTVALMQRLAERTRTQADDLLVAILRSSEGRLVEAVRTLLEDPGQPLTEERISAALASVGIRVERAGGEAAGPLKER